MHKNKQTLIFLLLFIFKSLYNQNECPEPSRKARNFFEEAKKSYNNYNPSLAYKYLLMAVKEDTQFAKAYLILADVNIQNYKSTNNASLAINYKNKAIEYYKKSANACPSLENYRACYEVGYYLYQDKNYLEAQKYLNTFLKNTNKMHPNYREAEQMLKHIEIYFKLKNNPVPFDPKPVDCLPENSENFLPYVSPDGELLFFTARTKGIDETGVQRTFDLFNIAERNKNTSEICFENATKMPSPFNENPNYNQGAVCVTIDNNQLYVTICEGQNCDIWVSYNEGGKWTPLKNLGNSINGRRSWESQPSISADGKTLYFASIRPGNIGFNIDDPTTHTSDIWMSRKDENGNWLPAINLGPPINTPGNEKSPFIHSDSQTLYFASDGHYGLGGYDIYFAKLDADGKWSEPQNIGYPINTEDDELGLTVSTDGKKAFFSSTKLSPNKKWNIYYFDLPENARPKQVVFYRGQVKNSEGEVLTDAKVVVKNITEQKSTEALIDKITGKFSVVIPVEKPNDEMLVMVKRKDYAFTSALFKADEINMEKPIEVNFEVKPIEVGTTVELNNIYFETNSAEINKSSLAVLDNFLEFLNENKNVYIELHGHTDNVGDPKFNQELSERRAKAVADYLIFNGLDPKRIVAVKGFGQYRPIATNNTEEGRAKNRRTEFVIVKK
ncbi:MAG: OmpA family protein [Bacteroidales bacterium]|nr:OmpA family protein [Bacteroidales bacterium]